MSFDEQDRQTLQNVKSSVLVPAHSTTSLDEILQSHPDIDQRSTLYFDESLRLIILLDFPPCPEERLQSYLKRLELRVDAWALSPQNGEERSPVDGGLSRDLVASEQVLRLEDPVTLVQQGDTDDEVRLQLVWETTLILGRPRLRSLDQTIVFVPVATISEGLENQKAVDASCLDPFMFLKSNILSPPGPLPAIDHPFLPLSALESVSPMSSKKKDRIRLKHETSAPIPAYAAVVPRLRYSKLNVFQVDPITIASLDLEMVPFSNIRGRIESIDVTLTSGKATSLMPGFLPMSCKSQDSMTFLYRLRSLQQSSTSTSIDSAQTSVIPSTNPNIDVLSIRILMHLFISEATTATIKTAWTTNVDFSLALNPAFGAPSQTLQRTNRPTSLNFSPYPNSTNAKDRNTVKAASKASTRSSSTSLQHQMIPSSIPRQPFTSVLSVSFMASDSNPRVGIPFSWRVLIVNNSPKPVKIAIVPLPRIQRPTSANQHFAKRHAPKASNSTLPTIPVGSASARAHAHNTNGGSVAKAVVEEHVLFALHHQASSAGAAAVPPEADLISLTAELRIGPLGVKQCHEAEIKFIAYKSGVLTIDAIRVVDLTGETEGHVGAINDIRDLPEIAVVEAGEETRSDDDNNTNGNSSGEEVDE